MAEQRKKLRIGELLIQQGLITPDQLGIALAEQKQNKTFSPWRPIVNAYNSR